MIKDLGDYLKENDPKFFAAGVGLDSAHEQYIMPWLLDENFSEICAPMLDGLYADRSFSKPAARMIRRYAGDQEDLTQTDINNISMSLIALFYHTWLKEWATRAAEYDPIENYKMTEIMTNDEKVTEYGRTATRTDNLSETTTPNLTTTVNNKIYGFNSSTGVPDTDSTTTATGSSVTANTGTSSDGLSGSDTETRNYTLTREGNIGVTTSQQMLQAERDLWKWNFFTEVVFPDMDKVLTLKVYNEGRIY